MNNRTDILLFMEQKQHKEKRVRAKLGLSRATPVFIIYFYTRMTMEEISKLSLDQFELLLVCKRRSLTIGGSINYHTLFAISIIFS